MLTRAEALARLGVLAQGIDEPCESAAVERFLERVAGSPAEVRDALLLLGAEAAIRAAHERKAAA